VSVTTEVQTMQAYHLAGDRIALREQEVPTPGPHEILIEVKAVSLNRRDEAIRLGTYPLPAVHDVVPVSDGAGEVVAIGEAVTRFTVGDRVVGNYWPRWIDGPLTPALIDQLGCTVDGMLAEYAVLDEQTAAAVPEHLSWQEAATLPCAALTAWNSLVGGAPLQPGQTVLTLGTGAVSLFAVQFARLLGCQVISTTSNLANRPKLEALGADHVIDYRATPEWGQTVRELTGGRGVDLVVETHGPDTIEQSMRATSLHGQIVLLITGNTRGSGIEISNQAYASTMATIRRVFVGSRADLEAMNRAVSTHGLRPVVDRIFPFAEAKQAYDYFASNEAFGKVVIRTSL
jgi:NADPH:quinone reductase-like Zn-dependent oxidoreductase